MPISVLHVYRSYFPDPPGGIQEAIKQISFATQKYGVNSKIFTLSPNPFPRNIISSEGEVIRFKSWACPSSCDLGLASSIFEFRKLAKNVDLVHFHFPWPFGDAIYFLSRIKTPSIVTYHSDIVKQKFLKIPYYLLMINFLKSMDAIVATSANYANTSKILNSKTLKNKLHVIPLGIKDDLEICKTPLGRNAEANEPFVFALGALRSYKGFHTLIHAASKIRAMIYIAGIGPEKANLIALAKKLNVNNVIFLGKLSEDEKRWYFQNCVLFVLPSHLRSEAFGMVLVEAAMHSKPMISCEIGTGTSFVNIDGETGIVIEPNSPDQLSSAANSLIMNIEKASEMGANARIRYLNFFNDNYLGIKYFNLYESIINSSR